MTSEPALLEIDDLRVEFGRYDERIRATRGVTLSVAQGEAVGVVGESGSGKSITALAILGLLPKGAHVISGKLLFEGVDLQGMEEEEKRRIRGRRISLIFQDPVRVLNPALTVGYQLSESIRLHDASVSYKDALGRSVDLLKSVGISEPKSRLRQYPHEFSGGMAQRVVIAMALANNVDLIIADEPTTALDVTVQAQIMELLHGMRTRSGASLILITHDLPLVAENVDRVAVMYAGRIVEYGNAADVFGEPAHPYTKALLAGIPQIGHSAGSLEPIAGEPLSPLATFDGCSFESRCPVGQGRERCQKVSPPVRHVDSSRWAECHYIDEVIGRE